MKKIFFAAIAALMAFTPMALAQSAPAEVKMIVTADMPSIKDSSKKDNFTVKLSDPQIALDFKQTCQAGSTKLLGLSRTERGCTVAGTGAVINPANGQKIPRVQLQGGYMVPADGNADAANIKANYLAVGKVPASSGTFGGTLVLKPELNASGAQAMADRVLKGIGAKAEGGLIDQRVDTVTFNRVFVPSAGLPDDKGCVWNGDMVFAYQTYSWYMKLSAACEGRPELVLEGNMPWTDTDEAKGLAEYTLTLTPPATANSGSNDALFANTSEGDLFAAVDGISGTLSIQQGAKVKAMVDGAEIMTASKVDVAGSIIGTNVPLHTVRSFGMLLGILSSTLYGA